MTMPNCTTGTLRAHPLYPVLVEAASRQFELAPERAHQLLAEGHAQFIDVRERHEWHAGHMPGSRWIPFAQLGHEAVTLDHQRPVVFVCRVGERSGIAAESFRAAGLLAYNLSGGLESWVAAGLPLEPPDGHVAAH
jgi:rhodanese-related sulfurtransferase